MPRACTVCIHPSREAVEQALLDGAPLSHVADEFRIASTSLRRHRDRHLAPRLAKALARREEIDADRLLSWLTGLHDKTLLGVVRTEQARDWAAMRGFIREARANIELLGRLAGVIDPAPSMYVDARRQTAVLASLSEEELRTLAHQAVATKGDVVATSGALPVATSDVVATSRRTPDPSVATEEAGVPAASSPPSSRDDAAASAESWSSGRAGEG